MIYVFAAAAVACWAVGLYGIGSLTAIHLRMIRRRTVFAVPGIRVARTRVRRLADLRADAGSYRGLLWARTADGLACRASGQWFSVIAECRQQGDEVVVDAVPPHAVRLFYVGLLGFMVVVVTMVLSLGEPRDWWLAIPVGLLLGMIVQYVVHVRRARAAGRLLPRYLEAACRAAAAAAGST